MYSIQAKGSMQGKESKYFHKEIYVICYNALQDIFNLVKSAKLMVSSKAIG